MRSRSLLSCFALSFASAAAASASLAGCSSDDTSAPPADAGSDAHADATAAGAPRDAAPDTDGEGEGAPPPPAGPPVASLRIANWVPDAPPFDVCLAPHGTTAFGAPLLHALLVASARDAGSAAIAFPSASAYTMVAPDTYDVRLVVAGATDCTVGIVDLTSLPSLPANGYMTLAFVGTLGRSGGSPLRVVGLFDDGAQGAALAPAKLALRVFNADFAAPSVDVTASGSPALLFAGVPFGAASGAGSVVSADGGQPPAVDPQGYATVGPLVGAVIVASDHGSHAPLADAPSVSLAGGAAVTLVVLPPSPGVADAGAALLQCVDNAGVVGLVATCTLVSR